MHVHGSPASVSSKPPSGSRSVDYSYIFQTSCRMVEHKLKQAMGLFLMSCRVEINIRAERRLSRSLLTNAEDVSRWNSTVTQIEGQIREGERLRIRVPGTDRTFTPRVSTSCPTSA